MASRVLKHSLTSANLTLLFYAFQYTFLENVPQVSPDSIAQKGTALARWLTCCATNRKVAGSIPAGVGGFFIDIKSF